jgi:ribosomal protein S18 acetylase RimI-like enzyme
MKTKKNKKKTRKQKKKLRKQKTRKQKMKQEKEKNNIISTFTKNDQEYNIFLYNNQNKIIADELIETSKVCLPDFDNEDVKDLLEDNTNDIYILKKTSINESINEIIGFIIIKNNYCDSSNKCLNCNNNNNNNIINCSYILLLCIKENYRKSGLFRLFFYEIEKYVKNNLINCIRLTATNKKTYNTYISLGFKSESESENESENEVNNLCEYYLIKEL